MIPESVTSETESELNQYIEDLSSVIVEQTITESTTPEVDSMLPDTYEKNDQDESSSVKTSNSEELVILTKNDIQDLEQTQMDMSSLAQNELAIFLFLPFQKIIIFHRRENLRIQRDNGPTIFVVFFRLPL